MDFTRKKFLKLEEKQQHKKLALILRDLYEAHTFSFEEYNTYLSWMKWLPFETSDIKQLADRYHFHLQKAQISLKEHNLLPHLRTGDHEPKRPFGNVALYLDNVRSAYNVGSILRTVEALRLGPVYFSEKTPFIDNDKVWKTSMGASKIVPCHQQFSFDDLPRPLIAIDTSDAAIDVAEFSFPQSCTLILGNEEYGISEKTLSQIDAIVEIPLYGVKNSINIGCAFSIVAHKACLDLKNCLNPSQ